MAFIIFISMPKNFTIFPILLTLICLNVKAQVDSHNYEVTSSDYKEYGLSIGLNYAKYMYGELGYYNSYVWEAGGFPATSSTMNYAMEFSYFDDLILAPKIQGRLHFYFFNLSLSALCYTNLGNHYAFKLRPEAGMGLWNFDINYGYNIGIYKNEFEQCNMHLLSIKYYLRFKRKHLNEYDRAGNIVSRH